MSFFFKEFNQDITYILEKQTKEIPIGDPYICKSYSMDSMPYFEDTKISLISELETQIILNDYSQKFINHVLLLKDIMQFYSDFEIFQVFDLMESFIFQENIDSDEKLWSLLVCVQFVIFVFFNCYQDQEELIKIQIPFLETFHNFCGRIYTNSNLRSNYQIQLFFIQILNFFVYKFPENFWKVFDFHELDDILDSSKSDLNLFLLFTNLSLRFIPNITKR